MVSVAVDVFGVGGVTAPPLGPYRQAPPTQYILGGQVPCLSLPPDPVQCNAALASETCAINSPMTKNPKLNCLTRFILFSPKRFTESSRTLPCPKYF
jgi:hypothetical protein